MFIKLLYNNNIGFCDGMGLSASTRAALIRQGLHEIALFCKLFDIHASFQVRFSCFIGLFAVAT